jgi:hypothetical protein
MRLRVAIREKVGVPLESRHPVVERLALPALMLTCASA